MAAKGPTTIREGSTVPKGAFFTLTYTRTQCSTHRYRFVVHRSRITVGFFGGDDPEEGLPSATVRILKEALIA